MAGLALASATTVFGLVIAEVMVRYFVPPAPNVRFDEFTERARTAGMPELATTAVVNDPVRFWRLAPDVSFAETNRWFPGVVSNHQGLREAAEISRTKPKDEIRILFVGDSCTFGLGVKEDQTIVSYTEKRLRSKYPGTPIECINAGVPAYSLFQGWLFLEHEGYAFEPDLVVLTFVSNDQARWDNKGDFERYDELLAARPPAALRWSRLGQLTWRAIHHGGSPETSIPAEPVTSEGRPGRIRLTVEEYEILLNRIRAETEPRGIDLLLVSWPFSWDLEPPFDKRTKLQRLIRRYGTEQLRFGPDGGTGYVDLTRVVQRDGRPPEAFFLDAVHATPEGNRLFAERIVGRLGPWFDERNDRAD